MGAVGSLSLVNSIYNSSQLILILNSPLNAKRAHVSSFSLYQFLNFSPLQSTNGKLKCSFQQNIILCTCIRWCLQCGKYCRYQKYLPPKVNFLQLFLCSFTTAMLKWQLSHLLSPPPTHQGQVIMATLTGYSSPHTGSNLQWPTTNPQVFGMCKATAGPRRNSLLQGAHANST